MHTRFSAALVAAANVGRAAAIVDAATRVAGVRTKTGLEGHAACPRLLFGVSLDGIKPAPWQPTRALHQGLAPSALHSGCLVEALAEQVGADTALTWLDGTRRQALDQGHFGLGQWAVSAKADHLLAQGDQPAAAQHLGDTVELLLTERPLLALMPIRAA